jgi:hypothetical protein
MHTELRWGNLEGSNYFGDMAVGVNMILKRSLRTLNGMMYSDTSANEDNSFRNHIR